MISSSNQHTDIICVEDVLELALNLTEQTSSESLFNEFLTILATCKKISSGYILTCNHKDTEWNEEDFIVFGIDENINGKLTTCHFLAEILKHINRVSSRDSSVTQALGDDQICHIIPITKANEFLGFIVLLLPDSSRDNIVFTNKLAALFSNYYKLINQCQRDPLTGLLNRGAFDKMSHEATKNLQSRRSCDSVLNPYLVMLDIDFFKCINDNFGHIYGDEVLILFARLIRNTFRNIDWQFRYGGEEFAIILNNIARENVSMVMERFRHVVETFNFPQVNKVTVSIGCAEIKPDVAFSTILGKADKTLYYSKTNGRNQSHIYDDLIAAGLLTEKIIPGGDIHLFHP